MFKNKGQFIWILFAGLIVFTYLFALGLPLLGPDEPRYAQVAREMFERGDWVTTTLGGHHWFEKPALLYWLQITFYNLFGVSEFSARLGSALFGLGTILSLWILGKSVQSSEFRVQSLKNEKPNHESRITNHEFANWLALIAASSLGLLVFSRGASFDIMITFPITASLVGFFIFENSSKNSPVTNYLSLITFYFFIGIGLIAKGLIGIVFPFAIVVFYYVLSRKLPNKTFLISLIWGTVLSVLVASSWYLPMYLANGFEFIDEFFIQHHFQRYTSNKYKHPQPFWFFWVIFPLFTIPWIPFFFATIWDFVKNLFSRKDAEEQKKTESRITNYELRLFAIAWMLVPLVFFSLSGSKLPGYILPALPAACILTAEYVYRFVQKSESRKYALQGLAFLTFLVVLILLQFVVPKYAEADSTRHFIETADTHNYKTEKILNLHTINHNIEFYGSGRLVRGTDGTQKRFNGTGEIVEYLKNENKESALVLVPHEYLTELTGNASVNSKVLDKNGELNIVAVELK